MGLDTGSPGLRNDSETSLPGLRRDRGSLACDVTGATHANQTCEVFVSTTIVAARALVGSAAA